MYEEQIKRAVEAGFVFIHVRRDEAVFRLGDSRVFYRRFNDSDWAVWTWDERPEGHEATNLLIKAVDDSPGHYD